jgi:hypothetical protein
MTHNLAAAKTLFDKIEQMMRQNRSENLHHGWAYASETKQTIHQSISPQDMPSFLQIAV